MVAHHRANKNLTHSTVVEAFVECGYINLQDEDFIKHVYEFVEIPRTATEERHFVILIRCQPPYFFNIPKITCVSDFGR